MLIIYRGEEARLAKKLDVCCEERANRSEERRNQAEEAFNKFQVARNRKENVLGEVEERTKLLTIADHLLRK